LISHTLACKLSHIRVESGAELQNLEAEGVR
jgi:hypothetical protein